MAGSAPSFSQCLSSADVGQIVERLKTGTPPALNDQLRKELLDMKKEVVDKVRDADRKVESLRRFTKGLDDTTARIETVDKILGKKRDKNELRLCEMVKTHGFLGQSLVGYDGVAAAFYLFKRFASLESQVAMLPAIQAAITKNELPKNEDYAAFIDRLRIQLGHKQIFGTQAFLKDDILLIAPIENEGLVDRRRKAYDMGPLETYIKYLEMLYRTPAIRERASARPGQPVPPAQPMAGLTAENSGDQDEVIRVESELVSLNVSVLNKNPAIRPPDLSMTDFKVFEDGREQEVSFFARGDTPFDLVLLLDLSGSTADKQGLIRRATKRFIEAARPIDRVGIVTFTSDTTVVSPLTLDREQLLKSVDQIKDSGMSHVWDSLLKTLKTSFGNKGAGRRRAVVMMSDGVDNAMNTLPRGSLTSFAELVEEVRNDDTIVIPIYIDTGDDADRAFRSARRSMSILAEESGGRFYSAGKLENLDGVYETVLSDLGTIYSIGYTPSVPGANGSWHSLNVELPKHADLTVRTRQGYFVKK